MYSRLTNLKQRVFETIGRAVSSCKIDDTIVIAGTGRSGSTWLGEMLRGLSGYKYLNEPFMDTPLRRRTYLGPNESAPNAISSCVERALSGRVWRSWKWRFTSDTPWGMLREFASHRKVVVKFTRALRMIHWMQRRFSVRGTILLIRHPCAVISSMLRHGGGWHEGHLRNLGETTAERVFGRNLPKEIHERFEERVATAEHREEVLAHLWALDYHLALFDEHSEDRPWILVPYERLLIRGEDELRRITDALDVELTPDVLRHVTRASSSASDDVRTTDVQQQLSKWKNHLDTRQEERILSIAHTYGLDMYTGDLEPSYADLNSLQNPRYAWSE